MAIGIIVSMLSAYIPAPAGADAGCGGSGCIGSIEVPSGYSKYIVVFNDTCDVDQCAARLENYSGTPGSKVVYKYGIIKGVVVVAPDNMTDRIQAMDEVKYVEKAQPVHTMLDQAVPQIGANLVWNAGDTGQGVKVAVIDTGVDGSHPDLQGKIVSWIDMVQGRSTPYDDHGHGTHCAGIIAGSGAASNGKYRGVAPGASLMAAKVLDSTGSGDTATIIAGIDWAVRNGADVISLSLGTYERQQAMDDAVASAVRAGVVVVAAAGNGGPAAGTISSPGTCPGAITVGAVDKSDNLASFSSRGPNYDGSVKPDVLNVGVGVVAPRAAGTSMGLPINQYYTSASGTSMATPMTAGVVALLLEKRPSLTPAQVKNVLETRAKRLGGAVPNNNDGYGRVQAKAAYDYISGGASPTPTIMPTITPTPTPSVSPSPSVQPGNYGISMTHRWANYKNVYRPIEQLGVAPGTTVAQSVYYRNTGTVPDSYTITVSGIPAAWYDIAPYGASTVAPGDGRYANVFITPAAVGDYTFTVTVTSRGSPGVSDHETYTLHVGTSPSPSPSPSPLPSPSPSPSPTPPPTGNSMIKGLKYVDQNQDGRYQVTEPRVPGVTIRLYDVYGNLLGQRVTDHNGYYRFDGLAAGTYIVQEVTPIGYMSTSPSRVVVTLGPNQIYTLHFGNIPV